jgi:hypothetical protein
MMRWIIPVSMIQTENLLCEEVGRFRVGKIEFLGFRDE